MPYKANFSWFLQGDKGEFVGCQHLSYLGLTSGGTHREADVPASTPFSGRVSQLKARHSPGFQSPGRRWHPACLCDSRLLCIFSAFALSTILKMYKAPLQNQFMEGVLLNNHWNECVYEGTSPTHEDVEDSWVKWDERQTPKWSWWKWEPGGGGEALCWVLGPSND